MAIATTHATPSVTIDYKTYTFGTNVLMNFVVGSF